MNWTRLLLIPVVGGIAFGSQAQPLGPEQKRFHGIYKELVETNTSHSAGDNTLAAQRMAKHLKDAGFTDAEAQVLEPFPRKGMLIARFRGDGSKKPLLLLAHLDVVEALRADWKTDPFVLQESDGYFTARGSIDDKAMAAAFVSIFSQLRREGFKPKRDIILALTADREDVHDLPVHGAQSRRPQLAPGAGERHLRAVGSAAARRRAPLPGQARRSDPRLLRAQRAVRQRPAGGRHARRRERRGGRRDLRPPLDERALQRPAADHLRRHAGARRPRRERPAAIGHRDG